MGTELQGCTAEDWTKVAVKPKGKCPFLALMKPKRPVLILQEWPRGCSCSRSPEAPEEFSKAFPKPRVLVLVAVVLWPQSFPFGSLRGSGHIPQPARSQPGFLPDPSHPWALLPGTGQGLFPSWPLQSWPNNTFQTWGVVTHLPLRDKPYCLFCFALLFQKHLGVLNYQF